MSPHSSMSVKIISKAEQFGNEFCLNEPKMSDLRSWAREAEQEKFYQSTVLDNLATPLGTVTILNQYYQLQLTLLLYLVYVTILGTISLEHHFP